MARFCAEDVADVFRRVWPRHAAKMVAGVTRSPIGTVKRWVAGETEPRASDLIALMTECEDIRIEIDRLVKEARTRALHDIP